MRLFLLLVVFALACGDSTTASTTPFTVWVLEERLGLDGEERALGNATVVVDVNGSRMTAVTEGDGHARFEIDFAGGNGASVTAVTPDHTVVTALEASPETVSRRADAHGKPLGDLVILLPKLDRALLDRSVMLRGAIVGKRDAETTVNLSASALPRLGSFATTEATYEIPVPRDRAFFLLVHEMKVSEGDLVIANERIKTFRVDRPALGADAMLDIDIKAATEITTQKRVLRVEVPPDAPFGPKTRATASVRGLDSQLLVGPLIASKPTAEPVPSARVVELAVADTDVGGERLVSRVVLRGPTNAVSIITEPGVIADGTTVTGFLLPAAVPDGTNRRLTDPIPLLDFPVGAELVINVFAGDQLFWILQGPPGGPRSKTVTPPEPAGIQFSTDVQLVAFSIEAHADKRVAISPDLVARRH